MGERNPAAEAYLAEVATLLGGSWRARRRLLSELRQHIDDAAAVRPGPQTHERGAVLDRLGSPEALARAWDVRCSQWRVRQRRAIAVCVAGAAAASMLAVVQHAEGSRAPSPTHCGTAHDGSMRHCGPRLHPPPRQ